MTMKRQRCTAPALLYPKTESYLKLAYSIKWLNFSNKLNLLLKLLEQSNMIES
jgi:hypothetical protein